MIRQRDYDQLSDTDSDISIIFLDTLTKINKGLETITVHKPELTCCAAGGQVMPVLGKVNLIIYINGNEYPFTF